MKPSQMPTRSSMGDSLAPRPTVWIACIDGHEKVYTDEVQAKTELKRRIDGMSALRKVTFSLQHIQLEDKDGD